MICALYGVPQTPVMEVTVCGRGFSPQPRRLACRRRGPAEITPLAPGGRRSSELKMSARLRAGHRGCGAGLGLLKHPLAACAGRKASPSPPCPAGQRVAPLAGQGAMDGGRLLLGRGSSWYQHQNSAKLLNLGNPQHIVHQRGP